MKKVNGIYAAVVLAAVWFVSCQQASAECGIASTYSSGTRTANGEHYNHMGISAAHKSLPFGSRVVVHNQRTGRSIEVRINDRGPFVAGRIIDLSTGAKDALGMDGLAPVCLEVVSYGSGKRGYQKPSAGERLIEALNPFGHHGAKDGAETRSARAIHGRTRLASASHRHKHYAERRHGRKRYASLHHHRKRSSHRRSHRREFASRDDG
ncbi:MAG: septal ring lytic transglycosylase RlpA family protein [Rhodomicrobium sp.]